MAGPRLAKSLVVLRDQADELAPHRNRASDGWIGDKNHHPPSRHIPNAAGVVCALDVTDDPAGGCPIHSIAERVRVDPHPDLAYIISNRRIAGRSTGWQWHTYTGKNAHDRHVHFGVGNGSDGDPGQPFDDTQRWRGVTSAVVAQGKTLGTPRPLKRGMRGEDVRGLQKILIGAGHLPAGSADGVFGPQTETAVKKLQAQLGVEPDGIVGARTHSAIARLLEFLAAMPAANP